MKVDLGIWSKLTQAIVILLALAVLAGIATLYVPLIQQNEQYRRRIGALESQLQKANEQTKQWQAELDALRADPKTTERLAREKLEYAKPDEVVIHFEPPTTNSIRR